MEELDGNDINRVENVMTLGAKQHKLFTELDMWLIGVQVSLRLSILCTSLTIVLPGQDNVYAVRTAEWAQSASFPKDKRIVLATTDPQIGLPDRRYLALHAACAQVWQVSGMAEYFEKILESMEELDVLPEDGSSDVLMFVLQSVAAC